MSAPVRIGIEVYSVVPAEGFQLVSMRTAVVMNEHGNIVTVSDPGFQMEMNVGN